MIVVKKDANPVISQSQVDNGTKLGRLPTTSEKRILGWVYFA
jgi:hypothetical protein